MKPYTPYYGSSQFLEFVEKHYLMKEKAIIQAFLEGETSESTLPFGLKLLMEFLTTHFEGRRCILLIDEYDTPFNLLFSQKILRAKQSLISETEKEEFRTQEAHLKKLLGFFQTLLGSSLKGTEKFMEKAVVTGILRIAKANLFSSVNNLGEFGILDFTGYKPPRRVYSRRVC